MEREIMKENKIAWKLEEDSGMKKGGKNRGKGGRQWRDTKGKLKEKRSKRVEYESVKSNDKGLIPPSSQAIKSFYSSL